MEIRMQVQGVDKLQSVLQKLGRWAGPALGGALLRQGENIMRVSKEEVPFGIGALKATGHVQLPEYSGDDVSVTMGYGGPSAPYAAAVHEGYGPREIRVKTKRILAVLARNWKGGAVNAYGEGFPSYSKDGRYVLFGRKVQHPGYKGKKYLERPASEAIPGMGERMATDLRASLERTVR